MITPIKLKIDVHDGVVHDIIKYQ